MKTVTIYLRAIQQDGKNRLALFDSNRHGDINSLITLVPRGSIIVWKPDYCSGIKSITKVYSKTGKGNIFKTDPRKRLFCQGFTLRITQDAEGEEAYAIEYVLSNNEKVSIDPYIRIDPPK